MKKKTKITKISVSAVDHTDTRIGQVAVSLAGHDKGSLLVIVSGIDEDHVLGADGRRRTLGSPKKKKMRHLRILTKLSEQDTEKLLNREVNDSFLRKKLSGFDLAGFT